MITEDKITEIFCAVDEFCKEFDKEVDKKSLMSSEGKHRRYRKASLSESEIMTILIAFQFGSFRNFKHYYLFYIRQHLRSYFPDAVSYNRFVELESRVFLPDDVLPQPLRLRQMLGHQFRGLHDDSRMPQPATLCQQGVQGAGH